MKPSLYLFKRDTGGTIENPKTQIHFVIVDSDKSKHYPSNFVCVLPQVYGLVNGHSTFRRIFGKNSLQLAKRLLSKALTKESDLEISTEVEKRLKMLAQNNINMTKG